MKRFHAFLAGLALLAAVSTVAQDSGSSGASADGSKVQNAADAPLISKTALWEDRFAYLRIGRVGFGLADEIKKSLQPLQETNKLGGLILDLRFAEGGDYAAVGEAADLFFTGDQPLIKWDKTTVRATKKKEAIHLPLTLLVNGNTSGAAEALAALLRQRDVSLIIGSTTAGGAAGVEIGNGRALSEKGIVPDVEVKLPPNEERAYLEDPYRIVSAGSIDPDGPAVTSTNRAPKRRLNEADLVRMQEEGANIDMVIPGRGNNDQLLISVITDPSLARAIDFLKGVTVFGLAR